MKTLEEVPGLLELSSQQVFLCCTCTLYCGVFPELLLTLLFTETAYVLN